MSGGFEPAFFCLLLRNRQIDVVVNRRNDNDAEGRSGQWRRSSACTSQCARRAAGNLLDQTDVRVLSGRLLQHRERVRATRRGESVAIARLVPRSLYTQQRIFACTAISVAKGHVWTAPAVQEESDVLRSVRVQPCIRPVFRVEACPVAMQPLWPLALM